MYEYIYIYVSLSLSLSLYIYIYIFRISARGLERRRGHVRGSQTRLKYTYTYKRDYTNDYT